ncbi:hypothetical protein ACHAWT_001508 [Skeletonema menzelii]
MGGGGWYYVPKMVPRRRMVANTRSMETQYGHLCLFRVFYFLIDFQN